MEDMSTERATEAVESLHADRARAQSFGPIAADYDKYRTSYPDELIADFVDLAPTRVLDVACGTGKVAVPLVACGLAVLGVEPDAKMAAVARSHGVIVDVASFEEWDDEGRRFGLLTCGQGWHWIDPVAGPRKAVEVLEPGGTMALFWSYPTLEPRFERKMEAVYAEHGPDLTKRRDESVYVRDLKAARLFADIDERTYRWNRTFTSHEWALRAATFSDHQLFPADQREKLLEQLRVLVDGEGGSIDVQFRTYAIFARTPER